MTGPPGNRSLAVAARNTDRGAEDGRGLMLLDALAREWSYFYPPGGGKVVYCVLETS